MCSPTVLMFAYDLLKLTLKSGTLNKTGDKKYITEQCRKYDEDIRAHRGRVLAGAIVKQLFENYLQALVRK